MISGPHPQASALQSPGSCLLSQKQMGNGLHKGAVWHQACGSHGKLRPLMFLITPGALGFPQEEMGHSGLLFHSPRRAPSQQQHDSSGIRAQCTL